jgi:hypothetical protein
MFHCQNVKKFMCQDAQENTLKNVLVLLSYTTNIMWLGGWTVIVTSTDLL